MFQVSQISHMSQVSRLSQMSQKSQVSRVSDMCNDLKFHDLKSQINETTETSETPEKHFETFKTPETSETKSSSLDMHVYCYVPGIIRVCSASSSCPLSNEGHLVIIIIPEHKCHIFWGLSYYVSRLIVCIWVCPAIPLPFADRHAPHLAEGGQDICMHGSVHVVNLWALSSCTEYLLHQPYGEVLFTQVHFKCSTCCQNIIIFSNSIKHLLQARTKPRVSEIIQLKGVRFRLKLNSGRQSLQWNTGLALLVNVVLIARHPYSYVQWVTMLVRWGKLNPPFNPILTILTPSIPAMDTGMPDLNDVVFKSIQPLNDRMRNIIGLI